MGTFDPSVTSKVAAEPDDLDLKLALAVGSGMTVEAACEMLGVSTGTYYNRTAKNPHFFGQWRTFGELLWTKTYSTATEKAKSAVSSEEAIIGRFEASLKITDKIIKHLTDEDGKGLCTECGRLTPSFVKELIAGQKVVTQWIARHAASEAPKRVRLEGGIDHNIRYLDSDESAAAWDETIRELQAMREELRPLLPPANVEEGVLVP